jgi:hypothetical protein
MKSSRTLGWTAAVLIGVLAACSDKPAPAAKVGKRPTPSTPSASAAAVHTKPGGSSICASYRVKLVEANKQIASGSLSGAALRNEQADARDLTRAAADVCH